MTKLDNISNLDDCFGCGVCAASCPQKIIQIEENQDGFYIPVISQSERCTNCGICLNVCSFHNNLTFDNEIKGAYASWSSDAQIRAIASTGGVAFELAKYALSKDYHVCGVIYDNKSHRAAHRLITNENELYQTIGSKYIPSKTLPAFEELVSKENRNQKYIVFGTPCQIASLRLLIRKYRREDNFILIDFFCHGVPSLKVWDKYIIEKDITKVDNIKWRDKKYGWHDSWYIVGIDKTGKEIYRSSKVGLDEFFRFFLGHYALDPCCLNSCKFKRYNSLADIRVGDLWGDDYIDNEKGVNGVICFTEKGKSLFESVESIVVRSENADIVSKGQMSTCASTPSGYHLVKMVLRHTNFSLRRIIGLAQFFTFVKMMPEKIIRKIKTICHI